MEALVKHGKTSQIMESIQETFVEIQTKTKIEKRIVWLVEALQIAKQELVVGIKNFFALGILHVKGFKKLFLSTSSRITF